MAMSRYVGKKKIGQTYHPDVRIGISTVNVGWAQVVDIGELRSTLR